MGTGPQCAADLRWLRGIAFPCSLIRTVSH